MVSLKVVLALKKLKRNTQHLKESLRVQHNVGFKTADLQLSDTVSTKASSSLLEESMNNARTHPSHDTTMVIVH